jgi:hypothetical protein
MTLAPIGSPLRNCQMLSASWLLRLVREEDYDVPQSSLSVAPFIIGRPDDFHIDVMPAYTDPWITAVASDPAHQERVDELVRRSGDMVAAGDFGGHVWYTATLAGKSWGIDAVYITRMQEVLTNQTRILGWCRLGWNVLLNFREELPEGQAPVEDNPFVVHQAIVDVHIALQGPIHGPLTDQTAHRLLEEVAAICTFALGRPVDLPPSIFPARDESVAELDSQRLRALEVLVVVVPMTGPAAMRGRWRGRLHVHRGVLSRQGGGDSATGDRAVHGPRQGHHDPDRLRAPVRGRPRRSDGRAGSYVEAARQQRHSAARLAVLAV